MFSSIQDLNDLTKILDGSSRMVPVEELKKLDRAYKGFDNANPLSDDLDISSDRYFLLVNLLY